MTMWTWFWTGYHEYILGSFNGFRLNTDIDPVNAHGWVKRCFWAAKAPIIYTNPNIECRMIGT